jgi:hypothetical protein
MQRTARGKEYDKVEAMLAETDNLGNHVSEIARQDLPRKTSGHRNWIHYFLTEETSPLHRLVVEMQDRAIWICLAVVLQSLSTLDYQWYLSYVPSLLPFGAFIPFILILASFAALYMAFRSRKQLAPDEEEDVNQRHPRRWQRIVLIMMLLSGIGGAVMLGVSIYTSFFEPPQFTNDGTSLDTNAASLLLQGRNPYTDSNILSLVRLFPIQPYWTTPLRQGQLADSLSYPSTWELRSILDTDLKSGSAPEFESKVSYPALSFLTLVPFVGAHDYNVLPLYLLAYLALVAIGWKIARPEMRPLLLLVSLANVGMWNSVVGGNVDLVYLLFIVLSWLVLDQRWWSAIFLGLAVATKQPAWLFIPFYAILVYRRYGMQETIRRLGVAGIIFLAFNLPFMLWNPQAWLSGILAPVADPMFPLGVGLVGLGTTPVFSYLPSSAYTVMEVIALLCCLGWYWRICKALPEAAMLLAFLPLFFAWRSLPSYFYVPALPILILLMARIVPGRGSPPQGVFGADLSFSPAA